LSLAEIINENFKPMPDSDKAAVERYIESAMEQLNTAYEELSNDEQVRAINDAVQRFQKVLTEFQDAVSKVQPYATTDTDAAKLAVKLGVIAYAIQLVQQKLAEIQATINGATRPTTVAPQAPATPTVAPAPTPRIPPTGGIGVM
jgi:phage-related tail protein